MITNIVDKRTEIFPNTKFLEQKILNSFLSEFKSKLRNVFKILTVRIPVGR